MCRTNIYVGVMTTDTVSLLVSCRSLRQSQWHCDTDTNTVTILSLSLIMHAQEEFSTFDDVVLVTLVATLTKYVSGKTRLLTRGQH